MEGVIHPGENELRSRIGGDCLSVRLPPTLSLPCWQRICWSRRCQSLSSAVCPCQVLPLYTGLRSQHWILCHCFPHYKCCHLHHCSLWTFLWWSGGAAAVLRSKRLEWSQDRSRAEGCFRVIWVMIFIQYWKHIVSIEIFWKYWCCQTSVWGVMGHWPMGSSQDCACCWYLYLWILTRLILI